MLHPGSKHVRDIRAWRSDGDNEFPCRCFSLIESIEIDDVSIFVFFPVPSLAAAIAP